MEIQLRDYREVTEQFDRVVSVGMVEHVGYKNYRTYMRAAARSLGEDGLFLCQGICGNFSRVHTDPWIERYIFPNSMLPSVAQLTRAAEGVFIVEDVKNIGPELRPDTPRLGGKLPPRLAPFCRSLRRAFPANVAILSAQLRGRISGAQSAGLFDSVFERKYRQRNAHGSSRAKCTHLKSRVQILNAPAAHGASGASDIDGVKPRGRNKRERVG